MNKKPLIAIIPSPHDDEKIKNRFVMRSSYFEAIHDAGGIPVYIPYTTDEKVLASYCADFDGFLFSGGVDIDPKYYGETKKCNSVQINADRDNFEFALFKVVYQAKKPIFGICRGIQFLNVALGGSLFQHIDNHSQKESGDVRQQSIRIIKNSRLYDIIGKTEIMTNSFHHQVIKNTAKELMASAFSEDGYTEAIELPTSKYPFFMALQWHPELYYTKDEGQRKIFKAFIASCNDSNK